MNAAQMMCPMELGAIYPELLIAVLALGLVATAGWLRGWARWLPAWVSVCGLVATMLLVARMITWRPMTIFCDTYAVDGFANGFKLILLFGAFLTQLLLIAYFRGKTQVTHAPPAILFATLGGMGLISSLDLALVVLFLQMLNMATYLLVCLRREDPLSNEAALKYFIYGAVALAVTAYGLTFLYGLTGSLNMIQIGQAMIEQGDTVWLTLALGLVIVGYAFELTLVPFQFWAPDVYHGAPAPVSGFISVVPKVAAFAGLQRLLLSAFSSAQPNWPLLIAGLAAVTMLAGNLAALRQSRLKRLLAYSSIAQAGYIMMALAVSARVPRALSAVIYYLMAYLFMNLGAFTVVTQMEKRIGSDSLSAFRGLGHVAPAPAAMLTISLFSLAGIPPLAGFMGKLLLLEVVLDGNMLWLAVCAVCNMTIALYYYAAVVAQMYMHAHHPDAAGVSQGPVFGIASVVCFAGIMALGIFPDLLLALGHLFQQVVGSREPMALAGGFFF